MFKKRKNEKIMFIYTFNKENLKNKKQLVL